jgi:origin recognition complex subunit 3
MSLTLVYFITRYRKLNADQLRRLSQEIHEFLQSTDPEGDEDFVTAQTDLVENLPQSQTSDENSKAVAAEVADWIDEFLGFVSFSGWPLTHPHTAFGSSRNLMLERLEDIPLWEIWYMGMTPFPSEVSSYPFSFALTPIS